MWVTTVAVTLTPILTTRQQPSFLSRHKRAIKDREHQTSCYQRTEIDILVSKLLGFETFANFLRVSVSKNLVLEKVSVSENLVLKKSLCFGFGKLDLGKEKIKITRKKLNQVNTANTGWFPPKFQC